MDMPKPTAQHAALARLAGGWSGEETLFPSPWAPERRAATGAFTSRVALDGMYLITDYEERRDGAVIFRGHGVYGYDVARGAYTMHWFDSMGFPPAETLGAWDGDTLTFTNHSAHAHGRYVYELTGDDTYTFRIEQSRDGETWTPMMEGHYRRG